MTDPQASPKNNKVIIYEYATVFTHFSAALLPGTSFSIFCIHKNNLNKEFKDMNNTNQLCEQSHLINFVLKQKKNKDRKRDKDTRL